MAISGKCGLFNMYVLIFLLAVGVHADCDETQLLQHRGKKRGAGQVLASIVDAYESKRGLIISGTGSPQDIHPDHSGSILRADFPPMVATYVGLIFDPSRRPKVQCAFVVDGGTDHRKSQSGSFCGWTYPEFKNMSTRCDFPPEEYAQRYQLKPKAELKQWGATAVLVWAITQSSCNFASIDEMLLAEEMFWRMAGGISKGEWDKWGQSRLGTWSGPTGFNEVVFAEEVYEVSQDYSTDWVAIYWAHTGDFISDWSQTDESTRKGPCCITMNRKGQWCDLDTAQPVIEIANMDFVGWGAQYDYVGLSAYAQRAFADGNNGHSKEGYRGLENFRIVPKTELCALDCSSWNATTCDGWD
ncbi:unnamed protein product [Effrenium voratum]|uniref:Uncharacterized protein n=1 Tax=Effrenium voratum TaxID=2562239 RepID=A0AA36JSV3_9DINO|nr:unnamed protein product [Effrenium voratum]CAJ1411221.1 unnamed protein product [Effrenium voratum]CAJ1446451.1 unnamed protein product [Effrenium voratum]